MPVMIYGEVYCLLPSFKFLNDNEKKNLNFIIQIHLGFLALL